MDYILRKKSYNQNYLDLTFTKKMIMDENLFSFHFDSLKIKILQIDRKSQSRLYKYNRDF